MWFASHNQLHMYGFSNIVNLLDSSPGTALHLWSRTGTSHNEISKSSSIKLKWHGCFNKSFFYLMFVLLILLDRFSVMFSVGGMFISELPWHITTNAKKQCLIYVHLLWIKIKGILHPKWTFSRFSLTPMSFRTRKSFVSFQNTI